LGDDDADDIDGAIVEERIYHDAGREPVERDTRYRPVQRTEAASTVLV
jgi:aminodeoxyfutalosine synthase